MIEPNKYTDETIHVANWLIGNCEANMMLEGAMEATQAKIQNSELESEEYEDLLSYFLTERIEDALTEALGECFPGSCLLIDEIGGVANPPEFYQDRGHGGPTSEDIVLPFIARSVRRINLDDVANIIMEHANRTDLSL